MVGNVLKLILNYFYFFVNKPLRNPKGRSNQPLNMLQHLRFAFCSVSEH